MESLQQKPLLHIDMTLHSLKDIFLEDGHRVKTAEQENISWE